MSAIRISEIIPEMSSKPLEIRVIKKWKPFALGNQKNIDLWFLFVDTHGDAIEAMCQSKDESFFSPQLQIQKCYKINGYVSRTGRTNMAMVPHQASLKLGRRVTVEPLNNTDIPTFYYNFATFQELAARKNNSKLLTDFIGYVDDVLPIIVRRGTPLRKINIRDEQGNPLEITLRADKANLIQREDAIGQAIVVTATTVSEYNVTQLESTMSTTVEINPDFPQLQSYIDRFKTLPDLEGTDMTLQTLTIMQIKNRFKDEQLRRGRYLCNATIDIIHEHRGWFYVNCGNCGSKADFEEGKFVCADHTMSKEPVFLYGMNTIIKDETSTIEAGFFDDSLNTLTGKTCKNMVMSKGIKIAKEKIPAELTALIGIPLTLTINIKANGTVGVDSARKSPTSTSATSSLPPATPKPKDKGDKRLADTPSPAGTDKKRKGVQC